MRIRRQLAFSVCAVTLCICVPAGTSGCGDDDNLNGPELPTIVEAISIVPADHPTISPDNQRLACALPEGGIAICHLRTGILDTIVAYGSEPDWAPVGDAILFLDLRYATRYLATVSAVTGDTAAIRGGGFLDGAVWSPGGNEIVAHAAEGLVRIAYPSGDLVSIPCEDPDGSTCAGITPCWTPDDRWIAFRDGRRLLRVSRNGGDAEVVFEPPRDFLSPRYSPDGRWVVFSMQETGSSDWHLWAVESSGPDQELRRITAADTTCHSEPCNDYNPYWSPDGRQIYFSSTRSGQQTIWRIAFKS